jgi:hypothetical protein
VAGLDKPSYGSAQFGTVIGGPIVKRRNFFLVSYDGLRRTDTAAASPNTRTVFIGGTAGAGPARVDARGTFAHAETGPAFARTDHDFFGEHLTLRYVDQQFHGRAIDAGSYQPAISATGSRT